MKRIALALFALLIIIVAAGATWWHEINAVPNVVIPTPAMPSPNAFDDFNYAAKLVRDSDEWNFAAANRPLGFHNPGFPLDHYYSDKTKKRYLAENMQAIARVQKGLSHAYLQPPARSFSSLFPYYAQFRNLARLLSFAAQIDEGEGDYVASVDYGLDDVEMGTMIPRGGGKTARLVGIACEKIGRKPVWHAVDHLTAGQAVAAANRLDALRLAEVPLRETIQEEEWWEQASTLEVLRKPGYPGGSLDWLAQSLGMQEVPSLTKSMLTGAGYETSKRTLMADVTEFWNEELRHSQLPNPMLAPDPVLHQDWLTVFLESTQLWPDEYQCKDLFLRAEDNQAQDSLLEVVLALHAYRLDHGGYPASLSQLAPAYLAAIPADPFAPDQTLRYRRAGASYVLYSVGPDGRDDGGKPIDQVLVIDGKAYPPASHDVIDMNSQGDIVAGVNVD